MRWKVRPIFGGFESTACAASGTFHTGGVSLLKLVACHLDDAEVCAFGTRCGDDLLTHRIAVRRPFNARGCVRRLHGQRSSLRTGGRWGMGQRAHRDRRRLAQETLKLSFAFFLRLFDLEFGSRVLPFPI